MPAATTDSRTTFVRAGKRLRDIRRAVPMSQRELARRAGVSASLVSMIERGHCPRQLETLVWIAGALGVSLAEVFLPELPPAPPLVRPVARFVRSNGLTRREVARLLELAMMMFSEPSCSVRRT